MAALTANEKHTVVRGIGEIALRVNNLDAMQKFGTRQNTSDPMVNVRAAARSCSRNCEKAQKAEVQS